MLAVILRIFILVAILFFPGKALWEYINKQNHIKQAVVLSAKEVQENISQLTYAEQEKPKVEEENLTSDQLKEEGLFFASIDSAHEIKLLAEEQNNNSLDKTVQSSQDEPSNTIEKPIENNDSTAQTAITEPTIVEKPKQEIPEIAQVEPEKPPAPQNSEQPYIQAQEPIQKPLEFYAGTQKYEIQFPSNNSQNTEIYAGVEKYEIGNQPYHQTAQANYQMPVSSNYYAEPQSEIINIGVGNGIPVHRASIGSAAAHAAQEVLQTTNNSAIYAQNQYNSPHIIADSGSSPAEYIIASASAPIPELTYELNRIVNSDGRDFRVYWKIKNNTAQPIFLNSQLRHLLSPTQLYLVDMHTQRRLPLRYDQQIPMANCLLSDQIPPFGRIECSAQVGPLYESNMGITSNRVLVYLPNSQRPIRVFMNL